MSPLTDRLRPPARGGSTYLLVMLLLAVAAAGLVAYTQPWDGDRPRVATTNAAADPGSEDRLVDVRQELNSLMEEVRDLGEPVEEFDTFDQCAYLLGVSEFGTRGGGSGYVYGPGAGKHRAALAIDIRGLAMPQYQLLAFPGEEPPSIECNEDAGGLFTN